MTNFYHQENYSKIVTTNSQKAQQLINYGLMNLWGFNHYGATQCFLGAVEEDGDCCFAYWAIAYCYGPHYNAIEIGLEDFQKGLEYLKKAESKKQFGKQWERDLVEVTKWRFPQDFKENEKQSMSKALKKFSEQMKIIHQKYPQDLQIVALYAQSVMNLNPWKLWLKNGQPTPQATLARQILQKALKKGYHPQIYHLYIHLMELSPYFRELIPIVDELYVNIKSISHLLHMPSHIYIQVGNYQKSLQSNIKAVQADKQTMIQLNDKSSFYQFYRAHNAHFATWTAMFIGDFETAIQYCSMLKDIISEKILQKFGYYVEFYLSAELHVLIRFGKWQQILSKQIQVRQQFPLYKTSQRYSRSIAYAVLGKINQAKQELKLFYFEKSQIKNRIYGKNTCEDIFAIAEAMVLGQIFYREQKYEEAFNQLRKSVDLCDNLVYVEPWDWMQPPRHALGALLTQQNVLKQAEEVYIKDLKTYPNNIWSLVGLNEIYQKQGQTKKQEQIMKHLQLAKKNSRQPINVSCFCKKH